MAIPVPMFKSAVIRRVRLRAVPDKIKLPDAYNFRKSVPPARCESDKTRDDGDDNDHPVLEVEAQNGKVLDQKMQRPRAPIFRAE
jgi:hypothetical protein